jgi:hypothetical protein
MHAARAELKSSIKVEELCAAIPDSIRDIQCKRTPLLSIEPNGLRRNTQEKDAMARALQLL